MLNGMTLDQIDSDLKKMTAATTTSSFFETEDHPPIMIAPFSVPLPLLTYFAVIVGLVVLLIRRPSLADPRPEPLPRPFRRLRWRDLQT